MKKELPDEVDLVSSKLSRAQVKQRQLRLLLISLGAIVVLAIAGAAIYQFKFAPYRQVVISIDKHVVRMDYFLKRARLAGMDQATALQQLTFEQIVKVKSEEVGIIIPETTIDLSVRSYGAASENMTESNFTDAAFEKWYKSELKRTGMSSAEYRDMTRVNLQAIQLQKALLQNIPDTGKQVHLHGIALSTVTQAAQVKTRLNSGEDFAKVASEVSLDTSAQQNGGDLGWYPEGLTAFDSVIFNLAIGQISDVLQSPDGKYMIFMVSEIDPERAIDQTTKQELSSSTFYYWLNQEIQDRTTAGTLKYPMSEDTRAWVEYQLAN